MSVVLIVRVSGIQPLIQRLGRIKKLPDVISNTTMQEWGQILANDMKNAARKAGIVPFTGYLFAQGIRWEQRPKGRVGRLFIAKYGVQLDSMNPHYVSLKKTRTRLLAWAAQARSATLRLQSRIVSSGTRGVRVGVLVKPHPFILNGWRRARPKLNSILRRDVKRAII